MRIDKIKKTKSGKYKIMFESDKEIITYDDVILKNSLLYNQNIDDELLNKINIETKYYDIYKKTIKSISIRLRSKQEVSKYLDKFGTTNEDKERIISDLESIGLINDERFIKAYISDKIYLSNIGPHKIKSELLSHNLNEDIIDQELATLDENILREKLNKMINKKIHNNRKYSNYIIKQKIMVDLINLGYQKDLIEEAIEKCKFNNNIINDEYDRLYNKLINKYNGDALYQKIKEKLYQKGFDINEIIELIKEKSNF